jgi:trans-2,3-dihydro-3-hydroxyanthranilate isomerase
MRRPYVIVDVFTQTPLEGNPLAVFTDAEGMPPERMQRVAKEMNLSETVFVLPPEAGGDARIRIFTPGTELPFAGHPTLGSAFVLCGQRGLSGVTLETGAGPVDVTFPATAADRPDSPGDAAAGGPGDAAPGTPGEGAPGEGAPGEGAPGEGASGKGTPGEGAPRDDSPEDGQAILPYPPGLPGFMVQPIPPWEPYDRAAELLAGLGIESSELPVEAYRNGPLHVYVALDSEDAVARLEPDLNALAKLPGLGISTFAGSGSRWKTRNFAPALGVPEDPATGSAAGPLAVHLARHGWTSFGQQIEIRQGAEIGRPSLLYARADGTPDRVTRVEVGGGAVVVGRGEFLA